MVAAALVIAGLLVGALLSGLAGPPEGSLPGVALGSVALLLVERAVAFFAAWMIVLVVVAQAARGRLPIEISGRGVRYAEAQPVEDKQATVERASRRHDAEIRQLREAVMRIEKRLRVGHRDRR